MLLIHIYIVAVLVNYCGGFVIMRNQSIISRMNDIQVQNSPKDNFKKLAKLILAVHNTNDMLRKRTEETVPNALDGFIYNSISNFSTEKASKNIKETENTDINEILSISKDNLNENLHEQNETGLEPDEVFHIAFNELSNWDINLTSLFGSSPQVINKYSMGDELNRTESNKTFDFPLVPDCTIGASNCTKCQEVSPYCHYMYSEERCVYFSHAHASKFYECGVRWFPVEDHVPFFITLVCLLVVSAAICVFMILLRMKIIYDPEEIVNTDYEALRSAVQKIRERRFPESIADDTQLNPEDTQSDSH